MLYWQFVNGATNEICKQASDLSAACYKKRVNTQTPTLDQSKLFSFKVPKSQSQQANSNLGIRPKRISTRMMFLLLVIAEYKRYVNCLAPSSPSHIEHMTDSCDTSAVLTLVLLAKDRQKALHNFPISKIFLRFFLCKISCSIVWLDRTFQVSAQTLFILHSFYKFHVSFTFDNKLQKRNISKLMSACLSARPSIIVSEKKQRICQREISWNVIFEDLPRKFCV